MLEAVEGGGGEGVRVAIFSHQRATQVRDVVEV